VSAPIGGTTSSRRARRKVDRLIWHLALAVAKLKPIVDGLKVDPVTGQIWALQNQDGNSTLTIIDPETGSVSDPISYKVPSSSRGYDDVVFRDGKVFPIKRGVRAK
jgi:hypothetical protein